MAKSKILIVEDEDALRSTLVDTFRGEGFEVTEARDGDEGLAAARAQKPDIILLDIVMPVKDGLTMLADLRKDPWGANVPVVLLTNLSDPARVSEALASGGYDYLVKTDWKLSDVVAKIRYRLEHPNTARASDGD